jgi:large subunit ribosomal protein L5
MADDKADKKKAAAKPGKGGDAAAKGGGAKGGGGKGGGKARAEAPAGGGGGVSGPRTQGRPKSLGQKPRLRVHYEDKVRTALMERFQYQSVMQVPRFEKIVVNMGVGDALTDQKLMDAAVNELSQISGQKPSVRRARKSIANFKLRENVPIGCMVTLRGARMYEFYDRLINVAVPRIRDFRGLNPRSFDGRGNYSMGLTEQIIFPEINIDKVGKIRGMDVTIVTTAKTDEEGRELLKLMNLPFRQR